MRERLVALVRGTSRSQRLDPLARIAELVAARRSLLGGWEVVCVRHGRLAGSTTAPRGADPMPYIEALRASAEVVAAPVAPVPGRHRRGDREDPALARVARGAHRRGRRRLDLPGRRGASRRRRSGPPREVAAADRYRAAGRSTARPLVTPTRRGAGRPGCSSRRAASEGQAAA